MSFISPAEPGPALDRRIARLIDGPQNGGVSPQYSTDESLAADLVMRLESRGVTASVEQDADSWYYVFWAPRPGDGREERVASGSAATRPLAVCRAVLNLPLVGTGKRLRLRRASRGWIPEEGALHPAFAAPSPSGSPTTDGAGPQVADEDDRPFEPARAARES